MELTPDRLPAQLAAEPLRPAYLIAGPEPLRVLEAADAVHGPEHLNFLLGSELLVNGGIPIRGAGGHLLGLDITVS